jgi:cystathionine beta-synthase
MSDKQSKEKMDILRAVGAKVVVCPTDVEPQILVPIILYLKD